MLLGYLIFHINGRIVYLRVNFMCNSSDMHLLSFQMEYVIARTVQISVMLFFFSAFKCFNSNIFSMQIVLEINVLISSSFSFCIDDSQMSSDAISIGVIQGTCISSCVSVIFIMLIRDDFFSCIRQFTYFWLRFFGLNYSCIVHSCGGFYDWGSRVNSYYFVGI